MTREKRCLQAQPRAVSSVSWTNPSSLGVLGDFPLPVEVIPMARSYVARQLIKAGGQPIWREHVVTDNGNQILDVHNLSMTNPPELESRLNQIPGIVTVGIFAQRPADVLLISEDDDIRVINRTA